MSPSPVATSATPVKHRPRPWKWGAGILLVLVGLGLAAALLLDPWLKRTLEHRVARQSAGRYQLQISGLRTSLWQRSLTARGISLLPAPGARFTATDTLPHLALYLERFRVEGIGALALLRRGVVPIDSVALAGMQLRVYTLPARPGRDTSGLPLHRRLPFRLAGLRIAHFGLSRVDGQYGPTGRPVGRLEQGSLALDDVLISAAGAADTQRIAYAAALRFGARGAGATVAQHRAAFRKVQFASGPQKLVLDSLRIIPVVGPAGRKGKVQVDLRLVRLTLTGLRTPALLRRRFQADSLVLTRPALVMTPPDQPPPPPHQLLAPYLDRAHLRHFVLHDARARLEGIARAPRVENAMVSARDLRVDAAGYANQNRILYAHAWSARTGVGSLMLDAPYYRLRFEKMQLATAYETLQLENTSFTPSFTVTEQNRRKGHQSAHIAARLPRVQVTGLDYAALAHRGAVRARQLLISRPLLRFAGDGRFPTNSKPSIATPESFRKLPFPLDLRELKVTDCNLYFTYLSPATLQTGFMALNRVNGTIRNITSNPAHMTVSNPAVLHVTGWIQNQVRAEATFWVPLLDPLGRHRGKGTFGPGPITMLNTITEPTRLVRFERGNIRRAKVALRLDRRQATGTMQAEYDNLKLTFLSKKGGENQKTLFTKVKSKAANVLVIRDENPRKGGRLKEGIIKSNRNLRYSVFSLWRQGLVSGMLNSIGVPQKMAQKFSEAE
ncbi:hypothetical protein LJY25_09785 [Hymenobacter sp. BT175]|uniref:hypothetical protein n=1 Tax=Hymenobacter translucens TaxID=2886507 RepID=UPI001D0E2DD5|nr:hypothetical protein [Hymenobacter translucens]MCC2546732.1 hypothetical protein [Hymenobacter translucens]